MYLASVFADSSVGVFLLKNMLSFHVETDTLDALG
jgi:hypothetical protein